MSVEHLTIQAAITPLTNPPSGQRFPVILRGTTAGLELNLSLADPFTDAHERLAALQQGRCILFNAERLAKFQAGDVHAGDTFVFGSITTRPFEQRIVSDINEVRTIIATELNSQGFEPVDDEVIQRYVQANTDKLRRDTIEKSNPRSHHGSPPSGL